MQVESSATPLFTIDEVEQIQRKKVATIIGHLFHLTYAAFFDKLVQEEKVNRCHGCAIQHPSQRQHSCLMLDNEDSWFYYHDEAREQNRSGCGDAYCECECEYFIYPRILK